MSNESTTESFDNASTTLSTTVGFNNGGGLMGSTPSLVTFKGPDLATQSTDPWYLQYTAATIAGGLLLIFLAVLATIFVLHCRSRRRNGMKVPRYSASAFKEAGVRTRQPAGYAFAVPTVKTGYSHSRLPNFEVVKKYVADLSRGKAVNSNYYWEDMENIVDLDAIGENQTSPVLTVDIEEDYDYAYNGPSRIVLSPKPVGVVSRQIHNFPGDKSESDPAVYAILRKPQSRKPSYIPMGKRQQMHAIPEGYGQNGDLEWDSGFSATTSPPTPRWVLDSQPPYRSSLPQYNAPQLSSAEEMVNKMPLQHHEAAHYLSPRICPGPDYDQVMAMTPERRASGVDVTRNTKQNRTPRRSTIRRSSSSTSSSSSDSSITISSDSDEEGSFVGSGYTKPIHQVQQWTSVVSSLQQRNNGRKRNPVNGKIMKNPFKHTSPTTPAARTRDAVRKPHRFKEERTYANRDREPPHMFQYPLTISGDHIYQLASNVEPNRNSSPLPRRMSTLIATDF